jgi:hypothetical protein
MKRHTWILIALLFWAFAFPLPTLSSWQPDAGNAFAAQTDASSSQDQTVTTKAAKKKKKKKKADAAQKDVTQQDLEKKEKRASAKKSPARMSRKMKKQDNVEPAAPNRAE